MKTQSSQQHRRRLIRELRSAQRSLDQWSQRIRVSAVQAPLVPAGQISPGAMLLTVVEHAKQQVEQRLTELHAVSEGAAARPVAPAAHHPRPSRVTRTALEVWLDACRDCGRSLGVAFREAQAAADAVSAKILYGTLRELERLLWVLDPRQAH